MKQLWTLCVGLLFFVSNSHAASIGLLGVQKLSHINELIHWETQYDSSIDIIGVIFDQYGSHERDYLSNLVHTLGTDRIYHISLSPFGYTAQQVAQGDYDKQYKLFFEDIKNLHIKVVFRTMHEMNGGRYSRASDPDSFQQAWQHVYNLARNDFHISKGQMLFSLSYNSQDLPTTDTLPTQNSLIEFCNQGRIDSKGRCPRMEDYYPGDAYVDLVGVTLYNRGRAKPDKRSLRKNPSYLMAEDDLYTRLSQWNKPIIIDELGSTTVNFEGDWTQNKVTQSFQQDKENKNIWLRQWKFFLNQHPRIVAVVYFNVDDSYGASQQVLGEVDRSIILSPFTIDYRNAKDFLLKYGDDALLKIFHKEALLASRS